ncbi:hypothetical protein KHA96_12145 [Bacillus sp. FJAT-49711]|uniref:family 4 glycosyl hydrolase n=1 Tax=Bacillus sp. FJAT-49711 TaxID=2833585 RepID=UPI001BC94B1E|nr:hypothetical protein [Bacillus sp. FJAT-49711]MBS4219068.1 hypothetical protein [Bacillus sp. FJAT-49711]
MRKKIVLIGAGSVVFTRGLVMDLIQQMKEQKWHIALVDTDPHTLEVMQRLCEKMITAKKSDIEISYSTDRTQVLDNADYVVCTIGVGGRRAWEQDVFIPRKYGIYQPVGDSVGPGGISRAMRMIPAVTGIARDIKKYCPDAQFFNYSNPMSTICRAVRKDTGVPVIGLCHGVKNGHRRLSEFLGLDYKQTSSIAVGVNHMVFMYDFRHNGKDAWGLVQEKVEQTKNDPNSKIGPLSREVIMKHKVYPVSDDRHYSEFTVDAMLKNNYFGKTLGIDAYSFEKTIEHGDESYEQTKNLAFSTEPLPENFFNRIEGEHEQLMEIIDSIEHDHKRLYAVNMPNNGAVTGLPDDAIIELPAVAAGSGFKALRILDFPESMLDALNKHITIGEMTVEAALKGDKQLFIEAILAGGYMTDSAAASRMVDELISAQQAHLPQF